MKNKIYFEVTSNPMYGERITDLLNALPYDFEVLNIVYASGHNIAFCWRYDAAPCALLSQAVKAEITPEEVITSLKKKTKAKE